MKLTGAGIKQFNTFLLTVLIGQIARADAMSTIGAIMKHDTLITVVTVFLVAWGISLIMDAIGQIVSGSQGATKTAFQGAFLIAVGLQLKPILGFMLGIE